MKKSVMFAFVLFIGCLSVRLNCMDGSKPKFVQLKSGEDLSACKPILIKAFLHFANQDEKAGIANSIDTNFLTVDVEKCMHGEKSRVIGVLDGEKAIGFLTLAALDKEETRIAVHLSGLLPAYEDWYPLCLNYIEKTLFPKTKFVSIACPSKFVKLEALLKRLGFEQDDSYTSSIVLNPVIPDLLVGFTKKFD